jgi:AcrR family transcriptional regulator
MTLPQPSPPAALVVAHPGHELRLHGWLERARPTVFVLTDGSGHGRGSRLASTARLLRAAGATPGTIFGRFTDREIYQFLLDGEMGVLTELARELADALIAAGAEVVAADALEGYNPGHDLCRVLTDAAVALAARQSGQTPVSYEFPLSGPSGAGAPGIAGALRLTLDDAALARKLAAAHTYPEMAEEVERALAGHGEEGFREEYLRPVDPAARIEDRAGSPPFYETYGERQVAAGYYPRVLRLREHFLPAARALRELAYTRKEEDT